ncbi:MAG: response regulator [Oscillochloris sp.]|nr:response regulator [Oscillochloris sp.]
MTELDTQPTIVVIEDEAAIRRFLRATLAANGYTVLEAANGQEGLAQVALHRPSVVLLDMNLPDMDGLAVIERLRAWTATPIVVLSAREREEDKIAALDAGADDYVTKPIGTGELLARLRVGLRHKIRTADQREPTVVTVGDLHIDLERRQVLVGEREVHLTPNEYTLLTTLARYAGRVVTHRQLLTSLLGPNPVSEASYLRVYMGNLRQKIEVEPARPRYILTEPGVGYRLRDE